MHLPDFIADRLVPSVLRIAARQQERRSLIVEHHLHGVTPAQLTWWWSHIDSSERYRRWHPRDHVTFAWETPPASSHIGAVQVVREYLGAVPATLRIRYENPAGTITAFSHHLVATILDDKGGTVARLIHAYEDVAGGTRMRSTFALPPLLDTLMRESLRRHTREEMTYLTTFLPGLYASER